ncbi:MAG: hypothetical protein EPO07_01415 [Verrucomicrobia bacterium]|nr:MAG: hypothetical protein EPO07_01415 [Verrucomicrobiota bacterium]
MHNDPPVSREVLSAYAEYDRQVTISNFKVACVIGMLLMPAGYVLDRAMYPDLVSQFLQLRFVSSLVIGLFLGILLTPFGHRRYRMLGVTLFLIPASFIAWMIYASPDGATSPYYAGLNLVLLVLAFVLHWTFWESLTAAALVIVLYAVASFAHGSINRTTIGEFVNNLYFLVLTGVIVITGSYFHSKSRFREFALRFELDRNREALEHSNEKLTGQNVVLENTNKKLEDTIQKLTEAELQLVQSEKLASLGRMSAGIIHEINNPINYAKTGLYTLRQKGKYLAPEQLEEYQDILKDVEDGVDRVKDIVSDLRMFTHPDTEHLDLVDVAAALESGLRFLSNEWKDKVLIEQKLPSAYTVRANKNKLIQLLLNLVQNSLDALPHKPFNNGERPTIWIEGRTEGDHSFVVVRDNGPGIAKENLDKVFDPFFTTKDVGEGMGLGLSICYRIMQESGGRITVRSEPGKFCEFTLDFPTKG